MEPNLVFYAGSLAFALLALAFVLWPRSLNLPPRDVTSHRNSQPRHWGE
jgi:hypothetical protein